MKTFGYVVITLLSAFLLLTSCDSTPITKRATGLAYEAIVSMDTDLWNSELGAAVNDELQSAIPGLPQYEPSLRVTFAAPEHFNGILTWVRNIFILRVDPTVFTKASVTYDYDRWASGQVVVTMNAPDKETALAYLAENPRAIVNFIVKVEMDRAKALHEADYSQLVFDKLQNKFGVTLKVPSNMTFFRDTTGFFWASNNANQGRTDISVYSFPYTDPNTFTADYLVAKRDSAMKPNIPGSFPGSYMSTETNVYPVEYTPTTVNGKYCGVLRGLWRMQGDMMGGPFVAHVRLDEANQRVIVAEGFVYSPESEKRNFIRRIEAALHTLEFPGDVAQ